MSAQSAIGKLKTMQPEHLHSAISPLHLFGTIVWPY